jgi:4-hydroxy-tetrahydrodipicolinate synthase
MNGLGMAAGPCRQPLGKMTKSGVDIVRNAARETHRRDPSILKPIEHAYRVKIQKRLDDDSIWSALVY